MNGRPTTGSNVEQGTDGDFGVLTDADVRDENNNDGGEPVMCSVEGLCECEGENRYIWSRHMRSI
jgi:hypothetical protein